MTRKPVGQDNDEARRLDREYTGDAVNARTDELDDELHDDAEQLRREYGKAESERGDLSGRGS